PDTTTVDQAGQRRLFKSIDSSGRVGEVDEGSTGNSFLHQTLNTFDTPGATCRRPDPVVDNNLCRQVSKSLTAQTPDEDTSYVYNAEARKPSQPSASPALDSTWGYHAQYFQASGSVNTFDDAVEAGGAVSSAGPTSGRSDAATLFAVSDQTQMLSPRGNAA